MLQIGLVALALIHGRSLNIEEYPVPAASLAERAWAATASGGLEPLPAALRTWLSKTLQLEPRQAFGTATAVWSELKHSLSQHNQPAELNSLKSALARYGFDVVHAPPAPSIRPSSNVEGTPLRTPVPAAAPAAPAAASIPTSIPTPIASAPAPAIRCAEAGASARSRSDSGTHAAAGSADANSVGDSGADARSVYDSGTDARSCCDTDSGQAACGIDSR